MAISYFESDNRYTDPVRYFKANDPYYYEVDNIPIKQLEENSKFLKDQIDGLLKNTNILDYNRDSFSELKPYVTNTDSIVRVKPGRFTARINDAYTIDPLQFITQVLGTGSNANGDPNSWQVETATGANVSVALDKWRSRTADNATLMNGLFERTFVYPMRDTDNPTESLISASDPDVLGTSPNAGNDFLAAWPGHAGHLHLNNVLNNPANQTTSIDFPGGPSQDMFRLGGRLESNFIKKWRGVTRTSVVDVSEELEIQVQRFNPEDFYYIDENNNRVTVEATQRIDLLFIYSKAVDQSETTIPSYNNAGFPRTLTQPALGILRGAGVGVSNRRLSVLGGGGVPGDLVDIQSLDGTPLMIPNSSDELAEDTGFTTSAGVVRGSFPSPDDLLNLAPLLSEQLESGSYALIGQSILPIAYVVVRESAEIREGTPILTSNDLIDIRPFFRTTELTYNERAGLAAATPQASIANPVATEGYVDLVRKDLYDDYTLKIQSLGSNTSRVVGAGMIQGGSLWGAESCLMRQAQNIQGQGNWNYQQTEQYIRERYDYKRSISVYPEWDLAEWGRAGVPAGGNTFGFAPGDRIDFFHYAFNGTNYAVPDIRFGSMSESLNGGSTPVNLANKLFTNAGSKLKNPSTGKVLNHGTTNSTNTVAFQMGLTKFYICKKTINIDRSQVGWMDDYYVTAQFHNCMPLGSRAYGPDARNMTKISGGCDGIWIDKKPDQFTIFVAWVSDDWSTDYTFNGTAISSPWDRTPRRLRQEGERFAGFITMAKDFLGRSFPGSNATSGPAEAQEAGVCIYPTVTYQVHGVAPDVVSQSTLISPSNNTLVLI